jgi:hypothetical protein
MPACSGSIYIQLRLILYILLFKPHNQERAFSTGFAGLIEPVYRGVAIGWVRGTTD